MFAKKGLSTAPPPPNKDAVISHCLSPGVMPAWVTASLPAFYSRQLEILKLKRQLEIKIQRLMGKMVCRWSEGGFPEGTKLSSSIGRDSCALYIESLGGTVS